APFSYGQILFAGMYGYLIFDHTPDSFAIVGIAVICLSGLAVAWGQRKRG
ncbi:EamA/RhaT family transporter, partial [Pseudomonas chlororaphis]